jgi:hypothetical protein
MAMWEPSPPPEENWGNGANEDGEWPMIGIVGEEIDQWGSSMYVRFGHSQYSQHSNIPFKTDTKYVYEISIRYSKRSTETSSSDQMGRVEPRRRFEHDLDATNRRPPIGSQKVETEAKSKTIPPNSTISRYPHPRWLGHPQHQNPPTRSGLRR